MKNLYTYILEATINTEMSKLSSSDKEILIAIGLNMRLNPNESLEKIIKMSVGKTSSLTIDKYVKILKNDKLKKSLIESVKGIPIDNIDHFVRIGGIGKTDLVGYHKDNSKDPINISLKEHGEFQLETPRKAGFIKLLNKIKDEDLDENIIENINELIKILKSNKSGDSIKTDINDLLQRLNHNKEFNEIFTKECVMSSLRYGDRSDKIPSHVFVFDLGGDESGNFMTTKEFIDVSKDRIIPDISIQKDGSIRLRVRDKSYELEDGELIDDNGNEIKIKIHTGPRGGKYYYPKDSPKDSNHRVYLDSHNGKYIKKKDS